MKSTVFLLFASLLTFAYAQRHNFDLEVDTVTADFGQGKANEFTITYNHDNVTDTIPLSDIMDPTCTTSLTGSGLTVELEDIGSTEVTVVISVNFANITETSQIYTDGIKNGTLQFCHRLDVQIGGYSVNHIMTQISADVDKENSYSVTGVDVQDRTIETVNRNVDMNFTMSSYVCDDAFQVDNDPDSILPGVPLGFCVTYSGGISGISLASIRSVTLSQDGGYSMNYISDGNLLNSFTSVDCVSTSNVCRVVMTVIKQYFDNDGLDLEVNGMALLQVGSGRRLEKVELPSPESSSLRRRTNKVYVDMKSGVKTAASMKSSGFSLGLRLAETDEKGYGETIAYGTNNQNGYTYTDIPSSSAFSSQGLVWSCSLVSAMLVATLL